MNIDFEKCGGLVPAIIQDATTKAVLMLGYMNEEALQKTLETKKVTFWSRSRNCLWTKGETSGNFLHLVDIKVDCDNDTLLVQAHPDGPTCHKGTDTCWGEENRSAPEHQLERKNKPNIVLVGSTQDLPQMSYGGKNENAEEIREMVHRLPSQIRETIVLKYFSGMSIEEIAKTLGIPPGTVKSRLFNAKRILAEELSMTTQKGKRK